MWHRSYWAGLAVLAISACGPPPPTIATLPPGSDRTTPPKPESEDDTAQATGETFIDRAAAKKKAVTREPNTPPPVRPISERSTPSGLKIQVLQQGTGAVAERGLVLNVQYTAWVDGGNKFESTREQAAPLQFLLGSHDVIAALNEGVEGMKVGERRRLSVPPSLGYGSKGVILRGGTVPPDARLVYDLELVAVTSPGEVAGPAPKEPDAPPPVHPISEQALPSGLKIQVLQQGTGAVAETGRAVAVQYTGWLPEGPMFDTSRTTDQPYRFTLGKREVIAGWDEGVAGMKLGERRRLIIPPALGYGAAGSPPTIPGNATLVFDVELVALPGAPAPTPAPAAAGPELPEPFSAPGTTPTPP